MKHALTDAQAAEQVTKAAIDNFLHFHSHTARYRGYQPTLEQCAEEVQDMSWSGTPFVFSVEESCLGSWPRVVDNRDEVLSIADRMVVNWCSWAGYDDDDMRSIGRAVYVAINNMFEVTK